MAGRNAFVAALAIAGLACSSPSPANGRQACAAASAARRCPSGFECRSDDRCWRPGTGPGSDTDGGGGDRARMDDAALPRDAPPFEVTPSRANPSGFRQVPGGQVSSSANHRAVRTVAPPPGAKVMQSEKYRAVGGLVGATQR